MDSSQHRTYLQQLGRCELRLKACVHALIPEAWHDAEDVLQETKIKLWENFEKFEEGTDFGAWACTIARYEVRTYRKRQQRQKARFGEAVLDVLADRLIERAGDEPSTRTAALVECVRELNSSSRDLLRQCYMEEKKVAEIADGTGRTEPAVYMALSRVRRKLLHCVEDRLKQATSE